MWIDEKIIVLTLITITLWILVNPIFVTQQIGYIYTFFLFLYLIFILEGKTNLQIFRGQQNILKSLLIVGIFLIFLIFVFTVFENTLFSVSVLNDLGTYTSQILNVRNVFSKFTLSVVIPIAENVVFLSVIPSILATLLKTNLNNGLQMGFKNVLFICVFAGIVASLFHLYVRTQISINQGINFDKLLLKDFLFFGFSMFLSLYTKQLFEGILAHGIINFMVG